MPETIDAQFSELAGYAKDNARLAQAAELRARGNRRILRHRGSAALLGTAAVAAAVGLGVTMNTASTSPGITASPATKSAILTSYQTDVLGKAHVSVATVAELAKAKVSATQIDALAKTHLSAAQIAEDLAYTSTAKTTDGGSTFTAPAGFTWVRGHLSAAQIALLKKLGLTAAQIAALDEAKLSTFQIASLAR